MNCARLQLQERPKMKFESCGSESKPRRYCQKRMINPEHEEDPRWGADVLKRFHCDDEEQCNDVNGASDIINTTTNDDMFLTVQTLQFQGDIEQPKRSRTYFKYKTDTIRHRMFVKQMIEEYEYSDDEDRDSDIASYYFDDYVKDLFVEKSTPALSGKSSLQGDKRDVKTIQFAEDLIEDGKTNPKSKVAVENVQYNRDKKDEIDTSDTKVTYSKSGRRKSITISRTQSPETVQVIRVDVVCNYSTSSALSNYEERSANQNADLDALDLRKPHFSNKYLLTNTIKSVDENLSGGSKVTLLCKTFTLSERTRKNLCNNQKLNNETKSTIKSSKKGLKNSLKFQK